VRCHGLLGPAWASSCTLLVPHPSIKGKLRNSHGPGLKPWSKAPEAVPYGTPRDRVFSSTSLTTRKGGGRQRTTYPTFINRFNGCSCLLIKTLECMPFVNNSSLLGVVVTDPYSLSYKVLHTSNCVTEGGGASRADRTSQGPVRTSELRLPLRLCICR